MVNMEGIESKTELRKLSSFWKNNSKIIPGRPNRIINNNKEKRNSFQEFEECTKQLWSTEDEFYTIYSGIKSPKRHVETDLLKTHHALTVRPNSVTCNPAADYLLDKQHIKTEHNVPPQDNKQEESEPYRLKKFQRLLKAPCICVEDLKGLSWSGIPHKFRATSWQLLSGYIPVNLERRQECLEKKRQDYLNLKEKFAELKANEIYPGTYRQIHVDVKRMSFFMLQQKTVQEMFERILFLWANRHPATSYVQGINDLVTPFFITFLQEEILSTDLSLDDFDILKLPEKVRNTVEADTFWNLSKFLDSIQENYILDQSGIQHRIKQFEELVTKVDGMLDTHLRKHGVEYLQFSFRWINNLLTRELPLDCVIRLWDTYLAELDSLETFLLYVCAAFLLHWRQELLSKSNFQSIILMIQNPPTKNWCESDISILLAEAYQLRFVYSSSLKL